MNSHSDCRSRAELELFASGQISDAEQFEQLCQHLECCQNCVEQLAQFEAEPVYFVPHSGEEFRADSSVGSGVRRALAFAEGIPRRLDEPIPEFIGNYRITDRIGSGGMGVVYKAWHERLARAVVVKVIRTVHSNDESVLERFEQELRAIGGLSHPSIVLAHDAGTHDGQPFLVMELLEGTTLRQFVREGGPLGQREACRIISEIAGGVDYLHQKGLVHRDIKPSNVMVCDDGPTKLLDLGLALPTPMLEGNEVSFASDEIHGTVEYMAPEQAAGNTVDTGADVYSLGATLFYLLSGEGPLELDDAATWVEATRVAREGSRKELASLLPRVNRQLAELVDKALSADKEKRPTIEQFRETVASYAHQGSPRRAALWTLSAFVLLAAATIFTVPSIRNLVLPQRDESPTEVAPIEAVQLWSPGPRPEEHSGLAISPADLGFSWFVESKYPRPSASAAVWTSDTSLLACMGEDGSVRIYNHKDGQLSFRRVLPHGDTSDSNYRSLDWSDDGRLLAVAHGRFD